MRAKSLILLVLALGCGLIASIGITQVMGKRNAAPAAPSGETEAIFIAMQDISLGEPLSSQVLKLEPWPKDKVPEGALTNIEDVEGRRTRTKLYAGEPILANKLFSKGTSEQGATALIPKGYRVVGVKVDSVSGGSSMILPGDRVDVLVHFRRNPADGVAKASTRTILQDIKVFAVNDQYGLDADDDDGKSISAKTISLLVTPTQAQKVMLASQLGQVQLIMRSPEDDEQVDVQGMSPQELFGTSGSDRDAESLMPEIVDKGGDASTGPPGFLDFLKKKQGDHAGSLATAEEQEPQEAKTWPMRIMQGNDVSEVVLESSGQRSGSPIWRSSDTAPSNSRADERAPEVLPPADDGTDQPAGEADSSEETDSSDTTESEQRSYQSPQE